MRFDAFKIFGIVQRLEDDELTNDADQHRCRYLFAVVLSKDVPLFVQIAMRWKGMDPYRKQCPLRCCYLSFKSSYTDKFLAASVFKKTRGLRPRGLRPHF